MCASRRTIRTTTPCRVRWARLRGQLALPGAVGSDPSRQSSTRRQPAACGHGPLRPPAPPPHPHTPPRAGTDGQWWLDWDQQYRAWMRTNLRVVVTFSFTSDVFPPATWLPDP